MKAAPSVVVTIDDDTGLCQLVQDFLSDEGYPTECYPDGPSGLRRIAAGGVALVLLDWMLPGMSGAEILQRITAGSAPTPVVILTAMGPESLPDILPGADAVVRKPFDLDDLLMLVARYASFRG